MGNPGTFPSSEALSMNGKEKLLLAHGRLLEYLSKQSMCFVNSRGYLSITASRCETDHLLWERIHREIHSAVCTDCHVHEGLQTS